MSTALLVSLAVLGLILSAVIIWLLRRHQPSRLTPPPTPVRSAEHAALIRREIELSAQEGYLAVVSDRERRWPRKMARVQMGPNLKTWAEDMTKRFGNTHVRMGFHRVNWLTALMLVRYGEAEDYWPTAFTRADELRALSWLAGDTPRRVSYLPPLEEDAP